MTIRSTTETVLYAHLIPGTVNSKHATPGADIEEGELLGLAGNSGASSRSHMHILNNKSGGTPSWVNASRPTRFRGARAVTWSSLTPKSGGSRVKLNGRGCPAPSCAI